MTMNFEVILVLAAMGGLIAALPASDVGFETKPSSKTESIPQESKSKEETEFHEKPQAANEKTPAIEDGDIKIILDDSYETPAEEFLSQIDKDFEVDYVEPSIPVSPYNFYQNSMISPFDEDEEIMEKAANIAAAFSIYKRKKYRSGRPRQAQRRYLRNPYKRRLGLYYPFYPIYHRRFLY